MNAPDADAMYLVTDRRHDGSQRIVGHYRDPRVALDHAKLLSWAGAVAEVLVVATPQPDDVTP